MATLNLMKTGALLRFGTRAGAILGRAPVPAFEALDRYGLAIGEAFQIMTDDLHLDVEGDPALTSEATAGRDEAAGKATLCISIVGVAQAKGAACRTGG